MFHTKRRRAQGTRLEETIVLVLEDTRPRSALLMTAEFQRHNRSGRGGHVELELGNGHTYKRSNLLDLFL